MNTNILFGSIALLMALISGIAAGALAKTPSSVENIADESIEVLERAIGEVLPERDDQEEDDDRDTNDDAEEVEIERESADDDTSISSQSSTSGASVGSTPPLAEKIFTASDVATHNSDLSCYVIISGIVYDVTPFIEQHPGGAFRIRPLCGKDGTTAFTEKHDGDEKPANILEGLEIGILK